MKQLHIFTSAACNYIPKVRMLFNSLREHHPEAVLHLVLADEKTELIDLSQEPFDEVVSVDELNIPGWKGWAFCHSIVELATAIKPFYLHKLLAREDCGKVLYLDPDIVVFSPLDDILSALDEANLVLTPHQIRPDTALDAVLDNEICSLKHGIYNLGFIGVANTPETRRFADWWYKRLYHFCRVEYHHGLFTDQRWIDLVPAFFTGVSVMRSPRHNVAPWNLSTRQVSLDGGVYKVDGEPLGFYHFTGFDSGAHAIMAVKYARDNAAVQGLVRWYLERTRDLSHDPLSQVPWKYGTYTNGRKIEKIDRVIYRERVDLQRAFTDPFAVPADGSMCYALWLDTQGLREYARALRRGPKAALHHLTAPLTPGYREPAPPAELVDPARTAVDASAFAAPPPKPARQRGLLGRAWHEIQFCINAWQIRQRNGWVNRTHKP